jgi:hypothetical protein
MSSDRTLPAHNPKVAGSNPAPAMSLATTTEPSLRRAFVFSKASATRRPDHRDVGRLAGTGSVAGFPR